LSVVAALAPTIRPGGLAAALLATTVGLLSATAHLGRPRKAWRAFLGWRRSWLSREILLFGMFLGALLGAAAGAGAGFEPGGWADAASVGAAILGVGAVLGSAMVYIDTGRPYWSAWRTVPKFMLTSAVMGLAGAAALFGGANQWAGAACVTGVIAGLGLKLAVEAYALRDRHSGQASALQRSALLHRTWLAPFHEARLATVSGTAMVAAAWVAWPALHNGATMWLLSALVLLGELLERHLFFRAEAASSMPGAMSA
jgi:DMSO reductase anchor subunit